MSGLPRRFAPRNDEIGSRNVKTRNAVIARSIWRRGNLQDLIS